MNVHYYSALDASVRAVPLAEPGLVRPLMLTWARARRGAPALAAFLELVPQMLHGIAAR